MSEFGGHVVEGGNHGFEFAALAGLRQGELEVSFPDLFDRELEPADRIDQMADELVIDDERDRRAKQDERGHEEVVLGRRFLRLLAAARQQAQFRHPRDVVRKIRDPLRLRADRSQQPVPALLVDGGIPQRAFVGVQIGADGGCQLLIVHARRTQVSEPVPKFSPEFEVHRAVQGTGRRLPGPR